MVVIKTLEEIELLRESALVVSKTLGMLAAEIKPGVDGLYLDKLAEEFAGKVVIAKVNTDDDPQWSQKYGVTGIPHACLVDAEGNVAWQGHPADPAMVDAIKAVL